MSQRLIAPSFLAADFANVQAEVEMLNNSQADYIHIDIMDGVFVPNISFGFPVCEAIHRHAKKPMDFHLMIEHADPYLEDCMKAGAEIITVHEEACRHLHRTVTEIRRLGAKAGVVINPHRPVSALEEILPYVDLVLLMSVNPGFGGQKFIETIFEKTRKLKKMVNEINPEIIIEIDGGVNDQNAGQLFEAGADMLVAGSFVFKSDDPAQTIANLKKA
ncbi:MAG: ribulose-phosphate 3-epimerase [Ekhidna sp.]|uniref:ribulose-phosphate 3-epimerase n=1 Tax=Ekhidna sp. TaxID=2608089 RepID=UPI0032EB968A